VRKPGRSNSATEALVRHISDSLSNISRPLMAAE